MALQDPPNTPSPVFAFSSHAACLFRSAAAWLVQVGGCNLHRQRVKHLTACEAGDIVVATEAMAETTLGRKQPMTSVKPTPKKPYTKPTLTKRKALRDVTAVSVSVNTG